MIRKICVVTGSRAEYGLLYWLMKEIQDDADLTLQVVATGMHLSPEFGLTYRQIEEDGFTIDAKVEMLLSADTPAAITKSIGLGVIGFADALQRLAPDVLLVLGDRFEILAAVQAALIARVPVAHLHGGEVTEGAFDDAIRHAITKMSHFHFVAAEAYRRRVIQMGEAPERVFNFGAPGLDHISRTPRLSRAAFEDAVGLRLSSPSFLVTYHPVTLGSTPPTEAFGELLAALDNFPEARIILTKPNADTAGRALCRMVDDYVAARPGRTVAHTSLGQLRYLSALEHVDLVVGNSSSGLVEVPVFRKPTVNVGDRQKGRLRPESVIDCDEDREAIAAAIRRGLSAEFAHVCRQCTPVYGMGDVSRKIVACLKEAGAGELLLQKRFYDLPC